MFEHDEKLLFISWDFLTTLLHYLNVMALIIGLYSFKWLKRMTS